MNPVAFARFLEEHYTDTEHGDVVGNAINSAIATKIIAPAWPSWRSSSLSQEGAAALFQRFSADFEHLMTIAWKEKRGRSCFSVIRVLFEGLRQNFRMLCIQYEDELDHKYFNGSQGAFWKNCPLITLTSLDGKHIFSKLSIPKW